MGSHRVGVLASAGVAALTVVTAAASDAGVNAWGGSGASSAIPVVSICELLPETVVLPFDVGRGAIDECGDGERPGRGGGPTSAFSLTTTGAVYLGGVNM